MTERWGGTPRRAILLRAEMIVHLYTKEEVVCGIAVWIGCIGPLAGIVRDAEIIDPPGFDGRGGANR